MFIHILYILEFPSPSFCYCILEMLKPIEQRGFYIYKSNNNNKKYISSEAPVTNQYDFTLFKMPF